MTRGILYTMQAHTGPGKEKEEGGDYFDTPRATSGPVIDCAQVYVEGGGAWWWSPDSKCPDEEAGHVPGTGGWARTTLLNSLLTQKVKIIRIGDATPHADRSIYRDIQPNLRREITRAEGGEFLG